MQSKTRPQSQGQTGNGSTTERWDDELDAYQQLLRGSPDLDLDTNFGHGNYDQRIFYDQISNYRKAARAMSLFQRTLLERAIYETKIHLARDGITFYDDTENEVYNQGGIDLEDTNRPRTKTKEKGEEIWERLGDSDKVLSDKQVAAIVRKTNHDIDWDSFLSKVLVFYHESSRSVDAELVRDFLTGVKHLRSDGNGDAAGALLGGDSR